MRVRSPREPMAWSSARHWSTLCARVSVPTPSLARQVCGLLPTVALPGVDPGDAPALSEDGNLVIAGTRVVPEQLRTAAIHRLELPQGRFCRRLRLPAGRYAGVRSAAVAGCLVITLQKAGTSRG